MPRLLPLLATAALALLVLAAPAAAQDDPFARGSDDPIAAAAAALQRSPVHVDPEAEEAISEADAERVRERIREQQAGPMYIAILPASAADAVGGSSDAVVRALARRVGEPGTYVGIVGDDLRAGSTRGLLPTGAAPRAATAALGAPGGTTGVLLDLVDRIGAARRGETAEGETGSGGGSVGVGALVPLLLLFGAPALLIAAGRRKRRRAEQEEVEQVKAFAREDLVALGQDIRALDLDIEMPGVTDEARADYGRALDRYERADAAWSAARTPDDLEEVASLLEDGRHAIASVRARLEGEPPPEHRAPCFFDPRHGPSVQDVEYAPPGGQPRLVPVCAADATRIADGVEPHVRTVGGVPYWDAGPAYAPWATGFFGGGLLPGLFIGSMLGGFAFPGSAFGGGFYEGDGGFDGGLGGDFGGGGFDLGGGDLGGDFGGGGDL